MIIENPAWLLVGGYVIFHDNNVQVNSIAMEVKRNGGSFVTITEEFSQQLVMFFQIITSVTTPQPLFISGSVNSLNEMIKYNSAK